MQKKTLDSKGVQLNDIDKIDRGTNMQFTQHKFVFAHQTAHM